MSIDFDAAADRSYDSGRRDAIEACVAIVQERLVGWSITPGGLARQDEAEQILEAIRALYVP